MTRFDYIAEVAIAYRNWTTWGTAEDERRLGALLKRGQLTPGEMKAVKRMASGRDDYTDTEARLPLDLSARFELASGNG